MPRLLSSVAGVFFCVVPISDARPDVLRSAADLNGCSHSISTNTTFSLRGTVYTVDRERNEFVFGDATDRVSLSARPNMLPHEGDEVVASGYTTPNDVNEPMFVCSTVTVVGHRTTSGPLVTTLADLLKQDRHLQLVKVEGYTIEAFDDNIDPACSFILIKDGANILPVALSPKSKFNLKSYENARIRVTGLFHRETRSYRRFCPFIFCGDPHDIEIVEPGPSDLFDVPPLETDLHCSPGAIWQLGRRKATGKVIAVLNDGRLMLETAEKHVINVTLVRNSELPPCDKSITVVGYPETDMFRINLNKATYRTVPRTTDEKPEDAPRDIPLPDLFANKLGERRILCEDHGHLIRVTGTVQSQPNPASENNQLLLTDGTYKLPIDLGTTTSLGSAIPVGSEICAVGRLFLDTDHWQPDDVFPKIRNVMLVIRRPEDIRILARPSWWTPLRLVYVILGLLAALVGIATWNRVLKRMVNSKSRELLKEEVAHVSSELKIGERTRLAVELHDSLSQVLAGIAYQLTSSARAIDEDPKVAVQRIRTAEQMLKSCRTELHHCLYDLRSDMLEEPDFATAIRKTLAQLEGDATIYVRVNVNRALLLDATAHALLSIIRELVANAIHHGRASSVKVAGCVDGGHLAFSVSDNGCGFDPARHDGPQQGHFGLMGIRDRLRKLGGTLNIESCPGGPTRASFTITHSSEADRIRG